MPATDRAPDGRRSERLASVAARQAQSERAAREVVVSARIRHLSTPKHVITEAQALDPRRGYTLGNLLLDSMITQRQHDAGVKMGEDFSRYLGLKGLPFPSARAQNLFSVRSSSDEEPKSRGEAAKRVSEQIQAIRNVLLRVGDINTGRKVLSACNSVCVEDIEQARTWPEPMMLLLRKGLNKLGDYYGMPA